MRTAKKIFTVILAVFAALFGLVALLAAGLCAADLFADESARFTPSYEKIDLTPLLQKEEWTEEDYSLIYRQTGLSKLGADSVPREELPLFQDAFFFEGNVSHEEAAITTQHDILLDEQEEPFCAPIAKLENGDVLITSTCHSYGWRNGHAALVVHAGTGTTLESVTLGMESLTISGGDEWFREASNFLLLRLKDRTADERAAIAADAERRCTGIPYSLFVGFFSAKDQFAKEKPNAARGTHCSHLVWQSFKNAGIDLDSNGGPLVTARDIARSPLLEVVQVYGFDPDKLW